MQGRVLVVDDDHEMCALLSSGLEMRGLSTAFCESADSALQALSQESFDVVVTDLRMRGMNGLELCERIVANHADLPVIVITAFGSMDTAISAIRAGAYDYLVKPVTVDALLIAVERALRHHALQEEVKHLRAAVADARHYERLLGTSPSMRKLFDLLDRIGDSESSVLITGETGTGKELVARSLHERSRRKDKPFVAVNCAAMPEQLLESELFGHARGAFTDARTEHVGLLVRVGGGTLLLDEIADMPLNLQPKLLRALQERSIRPVGATGEVPFDARIIAATNRDLEASVEAKSFRADLYFRLNVITVRVPPLRERSGDILLLAQHFLTDFAARAQKSVKGMTPVAADKLLRYDWPGNVRELENCIEHGVALTRREQLTVDDLPERLREYRGWHGLPSPETGELLPVREVERRYIAYVLRALGGNKRRAASVLGFDRATLYRKLARYEIDSDPESE